MILIKLCQEAVFYYQLCFFQLGYYTTKINVKGIYRYTLIVCIYSLTSKQLNLSGPNFWHLRFLKIHQFKQKNQRTFLHNKKGRQLKDKIQLNKGTHKSFIYIYILCLSVCFFLYPINVKTAEPIGPKFFVGSRVTSRKVYG